MTDEIKSGFVMQDEEGISFHQIVMQQMKKVIALLNGDSGDSDIVKVNPKTGLREYRPEKDRKEEAINTIENLAILLESKFSNKMKEDIKIIENNIIEVNSRIDTHYKKWLDSIDDSIEEEEQDRLRLLWSYGEIAEDNPLYEIKLKLLLPIYKELFRSICHLLNELNYLKDEAYTETTY